MMPVQTGPSPLPSLSSEAETPRRNWLPRVANRQVELSDEKEESQGAWRTELIASGGCATLGVAGWLLSRAGFSAPALVAFGFAYLAGSWFTAQEVWEKLREREVDIHFLMLAVAAGAAAIGQWGEGTILLFLFSFSGALENYAMQRTQNEIRALFKAAPKTATVLDSVGDEMVVAVEELKTGQRLRIKPGEQFPVDAEVVKGETAADESTLTGEAKPVDKSVGDPVLAGTLNLWGVVEGVVSRPAQESSLQKIIRLIQNAQRNKAPAQRFTDQFGTRYTYGVLLLTTVMFFVWWLALDHRPFVSVPGDVSAFYHAMTLLVVASPCALVLSIPSAILAAIAWGAKRGILFRGGAAVEQLAEIKVVAMDKTGTLTTGDLRVEKVESFPPGHEEDVLQLAASMDMHSNHPLARAIVRHARQRGVAPVEIEDFAQISGAGITARCDGRQLRLGRRSWAHDSGAGDGQTVTPAKNIGISEVWLSAGDFSGRILLRDDIRAEARGLIEQLRRRGLKSLVLTGDHQAAAEFLRIELGLDDVRAGLKPEQKLEVIESLNGNGSRAAMIGDGVNDAPSLAAAHVGVAMGARGSDAALEQAAVVLMHDRLENFLAAYELSRRARTIIHQNLAISLGVIIVLVTLALLQQIPLTLGVVGHEGSTVVVVLNSLRLLFGRAPMAAAK